MYKTMLCCSAGMSTSMLVRKMQDEAAQRGLEADIAAFSATEFDERFSGSDVVLLGPQVKYMQETLAAKTASAGIPVATINMMDYGTMRGDKVLDYALQLIAQKGVA